MNKTAIVLFAITLTGGTVVHHGSAAAQHCDSYKSSAAVDRPDNTIAGIAKKSSDFSTLNAALEAAGLADALRGDGPFTVFAPTDRAFARLPKGTLASLLEPRNRDKLRTILLYHVVPKRLTSSQVAAMSSATTLAGQRLDFTRKRRGVRIDKAKVVAADVGADNGIVHAIDRVLLPASLNLVETAARTGRFNSLLAALNVSELDRVLGGKGPFTVLAPTDKAFARLGDRAVTELLAPANRDKLISVLKDHVIAGRVYADEAIAAGRVHSAAERSLTFGVRRGRAVVEGARIVSSDLDATNGVIHVIDRVILR